jgi:hypothetical protein
MHLEWYSFNDAVGKSVVGPRVTDSICDHRSHSRARAEDRLQRSIQAATKKPQLTQLGLLTALTLKRPRYLGYFLASTDPAGAADAGASA